MSTWKKIAISVLTFIFSFILTDLVMFRVFPANCQTNRPDQVLHHVLIPNSKCLGETEEFNVVYSANEYGLRDISLVYEKQDNTFRALFLGDSFTFGTGVNLEDTFVKQFERIANSQNQGKKIQTMNAGVPAYGLILEDLYLRKNGIEFKPDIVLVGLSMTDFFDERRLTKIAQKDENGNISAIPGPTIKRYLPEKLHNLFQKHSFVYNVFLKKQEDLWKLKGKIMAKVLGREEPRYAKIEPVFAAGDPDEDTFAITRQIADETFSELFVPVAQRLLTIKEFLDGKKIPMVVVIIPNGHQINASQWQEGRKAMKLDEESYPDKVFEETERFAEENKIPIINTLYDLRKHAQDFPKQKLFFDYDGHFTPLGHKIVAGAIVDQLRHSLFYDGKNFGN